MKNWIAEGVASNVNDLIPYTPPVLPCTRLECSSVFMCREKLRMKWRNDLTPGRLTLKAMLRDIQGQSCRKMFGKKTSKLRIHLLSLRNKVITILELKTVLKKFIYM